MIISAIRTLRHGPLRFLAPLWMPMGRAFRAVLGRSGLTVRQRIGSHGPFALDVRFAFSDFAAWGSDRHNDGFAACIEACRDKRCVFDVGAHIGLVSLPMATVVAAGGTVVSFEPAAANRALLQRHVSCNGLDAIVRVEGRLVGARSDDDVAFYESDEASGMNSAVPNAKAAGYRGVRRRQVSLDDYCAETGLRPEVIKIDVEGAEIGVLRGARRIVGEVQPTIFLSFHPRHVARLGHSAADLLALLDEVGYQCRHVDGSTVDGFGLREYILTPQHRRSPSHSEQGS